MICTKAPFKTEPSYNFEITVEGESIRGLVSGMWIPHLKPGLKRKTSFRAFPTECSKRNFIGIAIFQVDLDLVDKELSGDGQLLKLFLFLLLLLLLLFFFFLSLLLLLLTP